MIPYVSTLWALSIAAMPPTSAGHAGREILEDCPQGSTLRGTPPPRGRTQWCEGADLFGVVRRNGPFRAWHKNGRLRTTGQFVDGKRQGRWTTYDENGKVTAEQRYRFDRLVQERRRAPGAARPGADASSEKESTRPANPRGAHEIDRPREEADFGRYLDTPSGGREVAGLLFTEVTLSSQNDLSFLSTGFATEIAWGAFHLWGQWGFALLDTPAETLVEPLNPAFFAGYSMERRPIRLRFGAGASIPVHGFPEDGATSASALRGLATVIAAAPSRGLYDFWLYLPEFPVVALPLRADLELPFLLGRAEVAPYFAIPTRSGASTDLNLQMAVEVAYPFWDFLSAGARMQVVAVALTGNAQTLVSLEPHATISYGVFFARAGVLFNVVTPEAFDLGGGLGWGANLRLGVTL